MSLHLIHGAVFTAYSLQATPNMSHTAVQAK